MDGLLQANNHTLVLQYDTARSDVSALLDTLHNDVLPQLALELALPDSDIAWLSEWLSDIGKLSCIMSIISLHRPPPVASVFRLLRVSGPPQGKPFNQTPIRLSF